MMKPHVVILGAGPAGLAAAFQLSREGTVRVTVLEAGDCVGGNAGSFDLAGVRVDYGSHRLHPACDPEVLRDIHTLLGDDLLERPRHGRIRLHGRWIHFPLKPIDLALRLRPGFTFSVVRDLLGKSLRREGNDENSQTFASVLEAGLGSTICRDFYFPYSRKIWGLEPEEISITEARRRVSANSSSAMARRLLPFLSSNRRIGKGRFFYPRQGFGQISQAYFLSASQEGVSFLFNARVEEVEIERRGPHIVHFEKDGQTASTCADQVWSTIPITILARSLRPSLPSEHLRSAESISYRAMVLVYLVLGQDHFSEYDAHYFPEPDIPISRLSEPKNYSGSEEPDKTTVLCAELPCAADGAEWRKSDEDLGRLVYRALETAGIPINAPLKQVVTRRIRQAYPLYRQGYESHFERLHDKLDEIDGLLTFGRQGLFAHDNIHHALYMGYSAATCLKEDGYFDREQWKSYRHVFDTYVVED